MEYNNDNTYENTENTVPMAPAPAPDQSGGDEALKEKYGKIYRVGLSLEPDDDTEIELEYRFIKPKTASYDRYVKTMSKSMTKASKAFILDNVVKEDEERLKNDLEEYPALALSVSEKLLSMLGISQSTNLKLL